jgi:2,4-dienoyl-CoA reductase-like NADH-dependent reductase (Old Yellow Enzyme family)
MTAVAGLAERFPRMAEPLDVGPVVLRNRAVVTAHTTNLAVSHEISDRHLEYHRRRAAGGFGLIITEGLRVHPTSLRRPETLSLWTDDAVPGLVELTSAVHAEGAALFAQILHSGREAADEYTRIPSWGPSALAWSRGAPVPHAMTADEIDELVACYATAAWRAAEGGFDGVELHIGHGHLLQQFLSPATNHRDDAWGGDAARRTALVARVLEAVADALPRDRMALGVRISADEFLEGGLGPSDMAELTRDLVAAHDLDFVNVSHSAYVGGATLSTQIADMAHGPAPFAHLPAGIRRAVPGTPVMMACRVETVAHGEELLAAGTADAVALTRASIADPDLVRSAAAGRRVRRCTACNQLCIGRTSTGLPLSCVVNPEVGLETRWAEVRRAVATAVGASRPRLLVVGAGPSGMEAALAAAEFADVEVADAAAEPGGSLRLAASLRNRGGWWRLIEDLTDECGEAGVRLVMGRRVGPEDAADADAVVLATGATRTPRTFGATTAVLVERLGVDDWQDRLGPDDRVLVHDDAGFWPGLAAVEHLLGTGAEVHYVTPLGAFAPQITIYSKFGLTDRLRAARLRIHVGATVAGRDDAGDVRLDDAVTGAERATIAAVGHVFDVGSATSTPGPATRAPAVVVGDAYAPRDTGAAVWSGRVGGLRAVVRAAVADPATRTALERALTALPLAPARTARQDAEARHGGGTR